MYENVIKKEIENQLRKKLNDVNVFRSEKGPIIKVEQLFVNLLHDCSISNFDDDIINHISFSGNAKFTIEDLNGGLQSEYYNFSGMGEMKNFKVINIKSPIKIMKK